MKYFDLKKSGDRSISRNRTYIRIFIMQLRFVFVPCILNYFSTFVRKLNFFLHIPDVFKKRFNKQFESFDQRLGLTVKLLQSRLFVCRRFPVAIISELFQVGRKENWLKWQEQNWPTIFIVVAHQQPPQLKLFFSCSRCISAPAQKGISQNKALLF